MKFKFAKKPVAKPRALYVSDKVSNCPSFRFLYIKRSKQLIVFESGRKFEGGRSQCLSTESWVCIPARRKSKGT